MCDKDFSEDFDLTVLPVKKDVDGMKLRRPIHPMLPNCQRGANLLICSSQNSGKSNLLVNLLINSNFYKDCFDDVYIFSSNINNDQTTKKLKEAFPATCFDSFDEGKLRRILEQQKTYEEDERPSIAIILDDIQDLKKNSPFFTLSSNFRHQGVALLVYSVQKFTMVPPIVRSQATNLLVGTNSCHQLKHMAMEYQDQVGGEENFLRAHRMAVPQRYNFLYCDFANYPCRMYKNFDTKPIYEDDF